MDKDFFPIGKVIKPHGVKGRIKVKYFGDDIKQFRFYRKIFLLDTISEHRSYEISEVKTQPPHLILKLRGIDSREEAESLCGREIFIKKSDLPKLDRGEYYWFEILGMLVETESGKRLGSVKEIFPTGANDVYVVEGKRGDIFLPAIEEVIKDVDMERGVLKVLRMEGLWENEDEV